MGEERLSRMEEKIDQLVNAMTELVRVQEKQNTMLERLNHHSTQIGSLDKRMDEVEKRIPIYNMVVTTGGWIAKIAVTVVIGGIISSFFIFGS